MCSHPRLSKFNPMPFLSIQAVFFSFSIRQGSGLEPVLYCWGTGPWMPRWIGFYSWNVGGVGWAWKRFDTLALSDAKAPELDTLLSSKYSRKGVITRNNLFGEWRYQMKKKYIQLWHWNHIFELHSSRKLSFLLKAGPTVQKKWAIYRIWRVLLLTILLFLIHLHSSTYKLIYAAGVSQVVKTSPKHSFTSF